MYACQVDRCKCVTYVRSNESDDGTKCIENVCVYMYICTWHCNGPGLNPEVEVGPTYSNAYIIYTLMVVYYCIGRVRRSHTILIIYHIYMYQYDAYIPISAARYMYNVYRPFTCDTCICLRYLREHHLAIHARCRDCINTSGTCIFSLLCAYGPAASSCAGCTSFERSKFKICAIYS